MHTAAAAAAAQVQAESHKPLQLEQPLPPAAAPAAQVVLGHCCLIPTNPQQPHCMTPQTEVLQLRAAAVMALMQTGKNWDLAASAN